MNDPGHLHAILSDSFIRRLAGDRYYERGVDYFRRGLVDSLLQSGDSIEATVRGTEQYAVRLSSKGQKFKYTCECPIGEGGGFCKHCVATALTWLAGRTVTPVVQESGRSAHITTKDIEEALNAQEKETLIRWLIEWSEQDKSLRQRLNQLASLEKGSETLVAQVRKDLEKAIKIRGYRDYDQAPVYAAQVSSALEGVEALLQMNQATAAIDLCEDAMEWLEIAVEKIDDSNGEGMDLMGRVAELHLLACEQAKPDPELLGARLFILELDGGYSQWSGVAERYAHLLGDKGLAAFREAALKEWENVPTRTSRGGHDSTENYYSLTHMMESLARQSGDIEQLVAVFERDLSLPNQYLRIAGIYREAGNREKALQWAERGMACYSDFQGVPLRLFVAEEYRHAERHADALHLLWSEFRATPGLENYKLLEDFARSADDWEDWRDRALRHLRRLAAEQSSTKSGSTAEFESPRDWKYGHSLLVEVFLYEQNIEEAWREAQAGGCSNNLWLRLAEQREKTHPADAAAIYLKHGENAVARVDNSRYETAIHLLEKAAALMHSLGRSQEFETQFETLRQKHKAKRNLQKLAEARRSFLYIR
jgi:uncharacterized Zn finger protein